MSLIGDILPLSHIVLDLEVSSKKRLFEQAGLLLENEAGLARAEVFDWTPPAGEVLLGGEGHGAGCSMTFASSAIWRSPGLVPV